MQNSKPFMERAKAYFTPERSMAFQAIGQGLSQLAAGQPVNLSPAYQAMQQRQEADMMRKQLEGSGVMARFTPEQRAVLASMPPGAAQQIIAQTLFSQPKDNRTDDMREYDFAKSQGFAGSFADYMTGLRSAGAPRVENNLGSNGIDYGSAPTDMAWARNPDGSVRIDDRGAPIAVIVRGSPTDVKQTGELIEGARAAIDRSEAEAVKTENEANKNSVVLEDIGRARQKVESAPWYNPATGFLGNIFKDVGGTQAADVQALTDTVRANIGFDRLQAMREASPTGGALGNVTERELGQLQAVLGSLSQAQTESQLLENLDRLEKIYSDVMKKAAAYPNAAEFGFDVASASPVPGAVPNGVDPELWDLLTDEEKALWNE